MLSSRILRSQSFQLRKCSQQVERCPAEITIFGKTYQTDEWTNVTPRILSLIGRRLYDTPSNPLQLISSGICDHFSDFDVFEFPSPVVSVHDNFDSLLIPKDHVSRGKSDTYYLNSSHLLRCHSSAHQSHCLQAGSRAFICISDVYRRDAIDSTHYPVFHQCEGFKILDRFNLGSGSYPISSVKKRTDLCQDYHNEQAVAVASVHLHNTVEGYVRRLFGSDLKKTGSDLKTTGSDLKTTGSDLKTTSSDLQMRWVPAYFPFTHPSWELEIHQNGVWMEMLGAGIVEHRILCENGIYDSIAWAFGMGLERLAMFKYSIPDIRIFWSPDSGFLTQFKPLSPWDSYTFKPVSKFPQLINDISFWLPCQPFSSNDFYDLVRSVAGDLVEQVDLIDQFTSQKTNKTSHCYRIYYRSHERTLSQDEISLLHKSVEEAARTQLNVEIR